MGQDNEGELLALPAESKLLLVGPQDEGEKDTYQISSCNQVPGDMVIFSSHETISNTATAMSHHLVKRRAVTILLHDPCVFCTDQTGELNAGMVGTATAASFKSLTAHQSGQSLQGVVLLCCAVF